MKAVILITFFHLSICTLLAQDLSNIKDQKPFTISGVLEARSIFYSASGIANRRQPLSYLLSGNPTIGIYGLKIPISFHISESDRAFRQPFNQFGMSPTYKWLTIHAGYRNISFSPYTLGGHTMLGAGFEMNPGKLRLGFMYGRLNKATAIDTTSQALVPFSFSRKGYAARLGYGSERNFFELSYLSAMDDEDTKPEGLSALQDLINPAKNDVFGYSMKLTFFKKMFFESSGAFSIYTKDLNSPLQQPAFLNNFLRNAQTYFQMNATTEYYSAFSGILGYKGKNIGLSLSYKRIEPDYKTMGAYFFNSDLENRTLNSSAVFLKGKVKFRGSIGVQRDNLKGQKAAQNNRFIASTNTSIDLTKSFGLDVAYNNFSDNQKPQTAFFADSLRIIQTSQNFGIMPRYFLIKPASTHIFSGAANFNSLNDFNNFFSDQAISRNIRTRQYFINYNINIPKKELSFFVNLNTTKLTGQNLENLFTGATLGGNSAIWKQKVQVGLSSTLTASKSNFSGKSFIINNNANLFYSIGKHHRLGMMVFLTNNKMLTTDILNASFRETRAELSYQLKF